MKKIFLTNMLPIMAAAVLLATSCSKDNENDNNISVQEQEVNDNQVKTISFSITVGRDANALSKATVDEGTLIQKFESSDQLVISGENISGTLSLVSGAGKSIATFDGELSGSGVESITDETALTATLTNATNGNTGEELTAVQSAESLSEAFQKYGYWTASFTYGARNNVELVQNTAFVKVDLPFHGTKLNVKIGETTTPIYLNGDEILAVPDGATLTSPLLGIDKTVDVSDGKVVLNIKNRTTPTDCIAGLFSVGADKQIFFSKGNLQATYDGSSWEWGFAANQWDYIGDAAANTKISGNGTVSENGTVDLFGWVGTSSTVLTTAPAMYGICNSTTTSDYGNQGSDVLKSDWGKQIGDGKTWQTLSTSEWQYLFNSRKDANNNMLYGHGKITVDEKEICGLIILPDGWTSCPEGLTFTSGNSDWSNSYTQDQWSKMESAGAVFLPAAGSRSGSDVTNVGSFGCYWSSTADLTYYAWRVRITSNDVNPAPWYSRREYASSVRLVCPL